MGKLWAQITAEQKQQEAQQDQLKNAVRKDLDTWFLPVDEKAADEWKLTRAESRADPSERLRMEQKFLLIEALKNYREAMQQDAQLAEIFRLAADYAKTDATATYGSYEKESAASLQVYKKLKDYQAQLDEQALTEEGDSYSFYERQVITANLFTYFERRRDGDLTVPPKTQGEKVFRVDGVAHAPQSAFWRKDERQDDDAPLFAHEPNANDIRQGDLGDCYLLATLSSIAETHPEKIREAMHDDGNGKVTVRFFTRNRSDTYTPVYVTVDKVVPQGLGPIAEFARNSLWVQTFERAWAASGLQAINRSTAYHKPLPPDVDERYRQFLNRQRTGPAITKEERENNPWLFDRAGKLHPWEPTYAAIEGGDNQLVAQSILGPGYSAEMPGDIEQVHFHPKRGRLDLAQACKDSVTLAFLNSWNTLHPEDPMNPQRAEVFKHDIEISFFMEMRAMYEVMFHRAPPLDDAGRIEFTDTQYRFTELLLTQFNKLLAASDVRSRDALKRWSRDNPQSEVIRKVREGLEATLGPLSTDHNAALELAAEVKLAPIRTIAREGQQRPEAAPALPLNGKYGPEADTLFEQIKAGEREKIPMTCSTKKKVGAGLAQTHAYSLSGAYTKTVGGKEFRFVRIRNPWGTRARTYDLRNGVLRGRAVSDTNGYMDLELNDYLNNFRATHFVGPSAIEKARKDLETQLTTALSEFRDVVITLHTGAGNFGNKKTYRLDSLTKTEVNGVEHTVLNLIPDGPMRGVTVHVPLEKYYDRFDPPQIGDVNPEKQNAARQVEAVQAQKLERDKARAERAQQDYALKQEQKELNAIPRSAQERSPYPDREESEFRLPYLHALGNLRNCFAATEGKTRNGSNEYYNMQNALNQMAKALDRRDSKRQTDGADAAAELGRTARAYLRHCEADPRSGVRRTKRMQLAKKLLVVASCYESADRKPQETLKSVVAKGRLNAVAEENLTEHPLDRTTEGLRRQLAGMLVDKFADIAANIPERKADSDRIRASRKGREAAIDSVRDSECFRSVYDRKDAETLQKEALKGEEAVYIRVAKEYNRLEKLAKNAPAKPVPERSDSTELLL